MRPAADLEVPTPESGARRPAKPYEQTLPLSRRDAVRADLLARIPRWYRPWAHLAFPSLVGLGMILASVCLLRGLRPLELLTVPAVLVLANFNEWRIHRHILHRRSWPLEVLFDRHTPEHHVVF